MEHAAVVRWSGGQSTWRKLTQMRVGRRLLRAGNINSSGSIGVCGMEEVGEEEGRKR